MPKMIICALVLETLQEMIYDNQLRRSVHRISWRTLFSHSQVTHDSDKLKWMAVRILVVSGIPALFGYLALSCHGISSIVSIY